jgi:hypothetical protein
MVKEIPTDKEIRTMSRNYNEKSRKTEKFKEKQGNLLRHSDAGLLREDITCFPRETSVIRGVYVFTWCPVHERG